jgi:hypothetical protein
MMGGKQMARPRKYQTDAQRQAAFRERSLIVDRAGLEELRTLLERFQASGRAAAREGDELARSLGGGTPETMLRRLCEHWESVVPATGGCQTSH